MQLAINESDFKETDAINVKNGKKNKKKVEYKIYEIDYKNKKDFLIGCFLTEHPQGKRKEFVDFVANKIK